MHQMFRYHQDIISAYCAHISIFMFYEHISLYSVTFVFSVLIICGSAMLCIFIYSYIAITLLVLNAHIQYIYTYIYDYHIHLW